MIHISFVIFRSLNGVTFMPSWASNRQKAIVIKLLPTFDAIPSIITPFMLLDSYLKIVSNNDSLLLKSEYLLLHEWHIGLFLQSLGELILSIDNTYEQTNLAEHVDKEFRLKR